MKKLSVLLVAAAVALSASAGIQFKSTHSVKTNKMVNKEMVKANISKDKASFRVINTQPEGELKSYNRAGQYDYNNNGYLYCGQQDGNRMDIVYAEDGKVYMKNILCGSGSSFGDYWVEGTIEGNEIHVALGQEIYYSDYYSASVLLAWGEAGIDADGNIYFIRDERAEEAVYAIDGETITLLGSEGSTGGDYNVEEDYHGIGLTAYWEDDDSWTGYLEWNTVLTEREPVVTPTVITEIPEGCEVTTYYRSTAYIAMSIFGVSNGMTDGKLIVAIDPATNDAYVQNPSWWHDSYNSWVKGTSSPSPLASICHGTRAQSMVSFWAGAAPTFMRTLMRVASSATTWVMNSTSAPPRSSSSSWTATSTCWAARVTSMPSSPSGALLPV